MNNPVRRNRNIGTKKSGFKSQSKFREAPYQERNFIYCEKSQVIVHDTLINFYIEPLAQNYVLMLVALKML
jgi:hypothetical protein